jgi:hypothetical protein
MQYSKKPLFIKKANPQKNQRILEWLAIFLDVNRFLTGLSNPKGDLNLNKLRDSVIA